MAAAAPEFLALKPQPGSCGLGDKPGVWLKAVLKMSQFSNKNHRPSACHYDQIQEERISLAALTQNETLPSETSGDEREVTPI